MTFEVTKDPHLTKRGDCVIAVNATKAPAEFSPEFKATCRKAGSQIKVILEAEGVVDLIRGWGSPCLTFADRNEMVGRKSTFVSDRTIMVRADKAAIDLKRSLIQVLMSPTTRLKIRLIAELNSTL